MGEGVEVIAGGGSTVPVCEALGTGVSWTAVVTATDGGASSTANVGAAGGAAAGAGVSWTAVVTATGSGASSTANVGAAGGAAAGADVSWTAVVAATGGGASSTANVGAAGGAAAGAGVSWTAVVAATGGGASSTANVGAAGAGVSWTAVVAATGGGASSTTKVGAAGSAAAGAAAAAGGVSWTVTVADVFASLCKTVNTTPNTTIVSEANSNAINLNMRSPRSNPRLLRKEARRRSLRLFCRLDRSIGSNSIVLPIGVDRLGKELIAVARADYAQPLLKYRRLFLSAMITGRSPVALLMRFNNAWRKRIWSACIVPIPGSH